MSTSNQDSPAVRRTILDMSPSELEAFISDLQEKRMLTRRRYEEAEKMRQKVRDEKARAQMETLLRQMETITKSIETNTNKMQKKYGQFMTLYRIAEIEGEVNK